MITLYLQYFAPTAAERWAKEADTHGLQAENVTEISMDMSQAYQNGAAEYLPNAAITALR